MAGRKPTVPDVEFLQPFTEANVPVLSTSDIQDKVGFSTNKGVKKRLDKLESDGMLGKKQIGPTYAWWITEAGREYVDEHSD